MRAITKTITILKKLEKENILFNGHIFYLTDFHKTKIGYAVANKLIEERVLEETVGNGAWFEKEWKIRKPVGEHLGVKIFYDHWRKQFFFKVKKGVYDLELFEYCVKKIDYLKNLGEDLRS
ncbi:MAG: hypothetical protein ABIP27_16735 [Flavobacterium circumlabens]|uniref:hypothetical protein n=1 Tax=Flavobacterium circumlabens TaxID=2133765 RepID=UPI003264B50A